MKQTFEQLAQRHVDFTIPTFPKATALSTLDKLEDELNELHYELKYGTDRANLVMEYTDCFLCLIDSAKRAGISIEEITMAMDKKITINEGREWVDNGNGTYSHKKKTTPNG